MVRLALLAVLVATPVAAQPDASADLDAAVAQVFDRVTMPEIEKIARGTVRRARRAIAIGPTAGAWVAYVPSPEVTEQAVTFGLGLEVFKVPVLPGVATVKALVEERVKAKLKQQIIDRFKGVPPEPAELDRMAVEVFDEVKREMLGDSVRGKTFERPRFSVGLEANRLFEAEAWMARTRLGIGIWKLTLAGSFAVGFGDDKTVFVGPELVLHALLSKSARSPVVDIFVRGDFEVTDRELNQDHVTAGARFLLDVL